MQRPRKRLLLTTWVIYSLGYATYGLGGVLFVVVMVPLSLLFKPFGEARRRFLMVSMHLYAFVLTRIVGPALQLYRVREIAGFDATRNDVSAIYVVNHWGRYDAVLLLGILRNAAVVIKDKYTRTFFYSSLVKHLGFVSVGPRSLGGLRVSLERCREVVHRGTNLIVFPEGTRTASRKLLPFNDLAFRIAVELGVDIVPVIIYSDGPFMTRTRGSYFPRRRISYRLRCLSPVLRTPGESPAHLSDRTRRLMMAEIERLDADTGNERLDTSET